MYLEKPPFFPIQTMIKRCVGVLIFLVISLVMLNLCLQRGDRYQEIRGNALQIVATAVRVEEDYDPEDGSEYDLIIAYQHDGKDYERIHKTYRTYKSAAAHLGEKFTIQVDPANPKKTLGAISSDCGFFGIVGILALIITVYNLCGPYRQRYVDTYGWRQATVEKDLPSVLVHKHRFLCCILPSVVAICILQRFTEFASTFLWVCAWLLMFVGLVILRNCLRKLRLVREGKYTIYQDKLTKKHNTYDSEDGHTYYLTFANKKYEWKKMVTKAVYDSMEEGDVVDAIYLDGMKKPVLVQTLDDII